jgi:WD40 repeat protein
MIHGQQYKFPKFEKYKANLTRNLLFSENVITTSLILTDDHFLFGDYFGTIYKVARLPQKRFRSEKYQLHKSKTVVTNVVTIIQRCPGDETLFVAGFQTGNVAIFSTKSNLPILKLEVESQVEHILWSPIRLGVLFVLDQQGKVYIWDLLENSSTPIDTLKQNSKISCISFVKLPNSGQSLGLLTGSVEGRAILYELNSQLLQGTWENEDLEVKRILIGGTSE